MTSSATILPCSKISVAILLRLILLLLLLVSIRYLYVFSETDDVIEIVESLKPKDFEKATLMQTNLTLPVYRPVDLSSAVQGANSTVKNYWQSRDEELRNTIANNKMVRKNKGVYLPLDLETMDTVRQMNEKRKQQVNNVCATNNLRKTITLENMKTIKAYTNVAVDDKHKLLYCYVPKVACTSWKVKLSLMSDKAVNGEATVVNTHPSPVDTWGGLTKYGIKMLSTYTPEQIKYRLENYFKFIFVRHPMERLVSAYRSKFEKRKDNKAEYPFFYRNFGKEIKKFARKDKTGTNSNITFEEFMLYVVNKRGTGSAVNEHWQEYNKMCHLCLIDYDFIGKFDSEMVDDISYTLRKISSLETDYWFPNVTAPRSATKYLEKYYGSIPKSLIDRVEETYSLDFELFGFDKGLSSKLNKTS